MSIKYPNQNEAISTPEQGVSIIAKGPDWYVIKSLGRLKVLYSEMEEYKNLSNTVDVHDPAPITVNMYWKESGGDEMEQLANMARTWFLHDLAIKWEGYIESLAAVMIRSSDG